MKVKLITAMMLLLGFAACTSDEQEGMDLGGKEILLTSEIDPQTRGVDLDEQTTRIKAGQQVGVFITGASAAHSNVAWQADAAGVLTNTGDKVYYAGNNQATITAYHPYSSAWGDVTTATKTFTVATDQSGNGYANSDLMWATGSTTREDYEVNLHFQHLLSKVVVTLSDAAGGEVSGADISVTGTATSVDFCNGALSTVGTTKQDIVVSKNSNKGAAIIVPQTLAQGTRFIDVVYEGYHYYYALPTAMTFESGKYYELGLMFDNAKELKLTSSSIAEWNTDATSSTTDNMAEGINEEDECFNFQALEDGCRVKFTARSGVSLAYSKDLISWTSWTNGTSISLDKNQRLYVRGTISNQSSSSTTPVFSGSGRIAANGNIMSLCSGSGFRKVKSVGAYCFANLFDGFSSLTKAPVLPAITLAASCYSNLFNGCTSLTNAPELPATTLAQSCYYHMFNGCTGLTHAPELPATTLAQSCYYYMFDGCTGLTNAPELPATTLAANCYNHMFNGCTSLTTAPDLPATSLDSYCYGSMFYGCTSLTTAPELPATKTEGGCYSSMFSNCTSLTTAPELPSTYIQAYAYSYMFNGCTSLTTAPELPAISLYEKAYLGMFKGCTSLTTAPTKLPATNFRTFVARDCYKEMFYGCTSLTTAPELLGTTLNTGCYDSMFYGCTNLSTAPELPATTLVSSCYSNMFNGCTKLNYVKAAFTTTPGTGYTDFWLNNVSETGTFVKSTAATWEVEGSSGIPAGWTVETY